MRAHGTRQRYRRGPDENDTPEKGCRCRKCTSAATRAVTLGRLRAAEGRSRQLVDAGPVRAHVLKLHAQGLPFTSIAELAGIASRTVELLVHGEPVKDRPPTRAVTEKTAKALYAVRANQVTWKTRTLAVGSQRRLQALAVAGWPAPYLAPRIGITHDHLKRLQRGVTGSTVYAGTARTIAAVYDELWDVDPVTAGVPAEKAKQIRTNAQRYGWLPAAAYDDDLIDLPDDLLADALRTRVADMDMAELARCYRYVKVHGERSPLVVAGAEEYRRRRSAARRRAA